MKNSDTDVKLLNEFYNGLIKADYDYTMAILNDHPNLINQKFSVFLFIYLVKRITIVYCV